MADTGFYQRVIKKCFPDLAVSSIQPLSEALDGHAEGWDNRLYVVNKKLIFRFPLCAASERSLEVEARVLPELRKALSIPVPQLDWVSRRCEAFNCICVGYPIIKGELLTCRLFRQVYTEELSQKLAWQLAGFLSELHGFPTERARKLGVPCVRDVDVWSSFYAEIESTVFPLLSEEERKWTQELFEDFLNDDGNFQFDPVLIHGDLSPDHILYDVDREAVSGIVDFGDMRVGDPAYDFQLQEEYGVPFMKDVVARYAGRIDDRFFRRLKFYEARVSFHAIIFGLEHGRPELKDDGLKGLRKKMGG